MRKVKNARKMADEKDKIRDTDVATNPETQNEDARATSDKKPQHKDLNDTRQATGINGPKYSWKASDFTPWAAVWTVLISACIFMI